MDVAPSKEDVGGDGNLSLEFEVKQVGIEE